MNDKNEIYTKIKTGETLDGHALQCKLSTRGAQPSQSKNHSKKNDKNGSKDNLKPCAKLVVKNLAFEATAKDLRELFGTYGQIKRCRLPKKFDGGHRGFAFVDFVTKQEAVNAREALQNTHLYGRHLILDWGREDDNLEDIRDKAKRSLANANSEGRMPSSKKRRK